MSPRPKAILLSTILTPQQFRYPRHYQRLLKAIEVARDTRAPWRCHEPLNVGDVLSVSKQMLGRLGVGKSFLSRLDAALGTLHLQMIDKDKDLPPL